MCLRRIIYRDTAKHALLRPTQINRISFPRVWKLVADLGVSTTLFSRAYPSRANFPPCQGGAVGEEVSFVGVIRGQK